MLVKVFIHITCALTITWSEHALAQGIYACTDATGRKITSDRLIAECADRTQQELSSSGLVKRVLGPVPTERERAAQEEKLKVEAAARAQEADEKRRDRVLLSRYPSRQAHDQERAKALLQIDDVVKTSHIRTQELTIQRAGIVSDFEFYKKDPQKAPSHLVRRRDENDSSLASQRQFVGEQMQEKKRINLRFDQELSKLNRLWSLSSAPLAPKD